MSTLLLLCLALTNLSDERFTVREATERKLSAQEPTLAQWRLLRTWKAPVEAQKAAYRVLLQWTRKVLDREAYEAGVTHWPSAYRGTWTYPSWDYDNGTNSWALIIPDGTKAPWIDWEAVSRNRYLATRTAMYRYLLDSGDLDDTVKRLKQSTREDYEREFRLLGVAGLIGVRWVYNPDTYTAVELPEWKLQPPDVFLPDPNRRNP